MGPCSAGGCLAPTSGGNHTPQAPHCRDAHALDGHIWPWYPPPQGFRGEAASPPHQCPSSTPLSRWKQEGGYNSRETNKMWKSIRLVKGPGKLFPGHWPCLAPPSTRKHRSSEETAVESLVEVEGGQILLVVTQGCCHHPPSHAPPQPTTAQRDCLSGTLAKSGSIALAAGLEGGSRAPRAPPCNGQRGAVAMHPALAPARQGWGWLPSAPGLEPPH